MSNINQIENNILINDIKQLHNFENIKKIQVVSGLFGTGKTRLIDDLKQKVMSDNLCDCLFFIDSEELFISNNLNNTSEDIHFLVDYLLELTLSCEFPSDKSLNFDPTETKYNNKRFYEYATTLKNYDDKLFNKIFNINNIIRKSEIDFNNSSLKSNSLYPIYENKIDINKNLEKNILESDELDLDSILSNIINEKGNRRLLLEPAKVCTEAFIVDLFNFYYPLNEKYTEYHQYIEDEHPVKIVLIIDNFENLGKSFDTWLFKEMTSYFYDKKFCDFIAYDTSFLDSHLRISDFFDLRLIIGSRRNLENKFSNLSKLDLLKYIKLDFLSESEAENYLSQNSIETENYSSIYKITNNIPALLNQSFNLENYNASEFKEKINNKISNEILKYCTDEEIEWLKAAVYLNEFDSDALKIFPKINKTCKRAYSWFLEASEYYFENNSNRIKISDFIKSALCEYFEKEDPELSNSYKNIVEVYEEVFPIFENLNETERSVFRTLAYFKKFDTETAIEHTYKSDSQAALEFIENHPDLIINHGNSFSLKEEDKIKLNKYNKLADRIKYDYKIDLIKNAWVEFTKITKEKIQKLDREASYIKDELLWINKKIDEKKLKSDELNKSLNEDRDKLNSLQKNIINLSYKKELITSLSNFASAGIFGALGYFFPQVFINLDDPKHNDIIQIIFLIIAAASCGFAIFYLIKFFMILTKKKNLKDIEKNKKKLSNRIQSDSDELDILDKELKELSDTVIKKNESHEATIIEISRLSERLKESYI